jgi:hypothetical protein
MHSRIHWARLAAKNDPNTITILVMPNKNWYQDPTPYTGPFPDTHVISHLAADTISYEEPTILQDRQELKSEAFAIQIFCIHHQNRNICTPHEMNTIKTVLEDLQIPQYYLHNAPPTPHNTFVNRSKEWNKLIYPPATYQTTLNTPPLPNFITNTTPKFQPQQSYYTDGSFIPPTQKVHGHWKKEKNRIRNIQLNQGRYANIGKTPRTTNMLPSRTNGHSRNSQINIYKIPQRTCTYIYRLSQLPIQFKYTNQTSHHA